MGSPLPHPKWRLIYLDPEREGEEPIRGQFHAEDAAHNRQAVYANITIKGRDRPRPHFVRGDEESFTFTATYYRDFVEPGIETVIGDPILAEQLSTNPDLAPLRDVRDRLFNATFRDPDLGRPPLFRFEYGQFERFDCFVKGLGGVEIAMLWPDGSARELKFDIELLVTEAATFDVPTNIAARDLVPQGDSRVKAVVRGDTFESIAHDEYNTPIFGILLRQDSLKAFPGPSENVKLPRRSSLATRTIQPVSFALSDDERAQAALQQAWDDRADFPDLPPPPPL